MEKQRVWNRMELAMGNWTQGVQTSMRKAAKENRLVQTWVAKKWAFLLVGMAFLLGRATILDQLSPFAIAFFAVVYYIRKDLVPWVGLSVVAGSLLSLHSHSAYLAAELAVFLLIQKGMEKYERTEISYVPIMVGITTFLVQVFAYLVSMDMTWFTFAMSGIEALLSFVLTLIFIQALPVFSSTRKNYVLRNEEVICLIILLASVMTGTVGWTIGPVSVEHVLSRYLILLFALVGGAPLGASVGVISGMILSLADANAVYQMSLLAFAGMLGGLMKEGGRIAVALGMLLGSSILSIYIGTQATAMNSTWESAAAAVLFFLTGKSILGTLAKYVPGTQENMKTHYDYARRVRDITAGRVEQFSEVFRQLSKSFKQMTNDNPEAKREAEVEHFMNEVAQKACASCFKRKTCWNSQFYQTYKYMTEMMSAVEADEGFAKHEIPAEWKKACSKTEQVLPIMKQQFSLFQNNLQWKKQIHESRQLVADQLIGVSQVMEDLAKEIKREGQELFLQEEQIRHALEELGLSIQGIDVISLEEGNVEIEIIHQYVKGFDECRKIIAPLLSDILGETITVKKEHNAERGDGFGVVTFGSAKTYEVETGVAGAAKGGDLLSGDSFSTVELGNGKFAVALSDGMGNGERAREESSTALTILQQLLQSGMDERLAIKSVNSVLMLRSSDEIFATVDMALIDLYSAQTTFMKIGSTPSFIRRGNEVIPITANNLPVGILKEIEVDLVSVQLQPGDILIMMTDGIYDAPGYAVNKELWMKRAIQEIGADDPQEIADCLLERIVRHQHGEITDDMTVLVARIERYQPEWATFRWPGMARIERPKVVS
ncbi:stage II sporulation protein E [Paenibacillus aurantius]|uniref:Stage II sporulation protein E n=1 Tax=Paenibacillus aurantius TaxID=2918900 RepID=A0AA96LHT2_9BACL|nr:stage II sporulation protein E [Paenibacillus aurantius]WNQ11687.1 stage II sporulation protein E [Paenibacillus aurantius]